MRQIAFYATPHEGAPLATLAAWNKQIKDMKFTGDFIQRVRDGWMQHVVSWRGKEPDGYNRYITHIVIVGANDEIVPYQYASILGMDTLRVVGDHNEVIQPESVADTCY